ncbi:TolC family protein [Pseudozobellia thermophila]|uniref:Outer membrane protein n=1 Tax=Pseudozobellia thermophila TaxID=192903 RepID=A0A1M6ISF6_9FLAO|nr:TolC family protein [Pseudozobellia thermophila]SHJ37423.1 outer membrane protein [Pseudozobellia thermophila]
MKLYKYLVLIFCVGTVWAQDDGKNIKEWSLQDCIDYALENNITVQDANLDQNLAEVELMRTKSSRLPNLFASASQSLSNGNTIDPITSDYVSNQISATNLGVSTSVTLFQGNQINNQIKQSRLLLDQNSLFVKEARNNIVLSVVEAYLKTLYTKEAVVVQENLLNTSIQEEEQAKARFEAGSIAMKDYTEAQSQTATNRYNLVAAKNSYVLQLLELKQLLQLDPGEEMAIRTTDTDRATIVPILDKMDVYERALDYLPEVSANKLNIDISEKDLDIAKGGYLPTLSLTGSIGSGYTSIDYTNFTDQLDLNFNQKVGLSLNIPIFNRNQTKAQVQSAQINIEKAKLQLKSVENEVYQKVESGWQNLVSAQEQMAAAKASQDAAEESYRLAQKKYDLGALSTTDLILSQNTYANAQENYLQAKYMTILYHQLLEFYQGNEIKL